MIRKVRRRRRGRSRRNNPVCTVFCAIYPSLSLCAIYPSLSLCAADRAGPPLTVDAQALQHLPQKRFHLSFHFTLPSPPSRPLDAFVRTACCPRPPPLLRPSRARFFAAHIPLHPPPPRSTENLWFSFIFRALPLRSLSSLDCRLTCPGIDRTDNSPALGSTPVSVELLCHPATPPLPPRLSQLYYHKLTPLSELSLPSPLPQPLLLRASPI